MKDEMPDQGGYFDVDDLRRAQKLSYAERMELLEDMIVFLTKMMPLESKQISLKLQDSGF